MKEITMTACVDNIGPITDFIDAELEAADCSMKAMVQINIALDEILSNIVHYAYTDAQGEVSVGIEAADGLAKITFVDQGEPFDPLEIPEPDITQTAEERSIGGLGIFMVKKTMKSMAYRYEDGKNILTITKEI